MKKISFSLLACAALSAFAAETVQELKTRQDWNTSPKVFKESEGYAELSPGVPYIGAKTFKVDPAKTYTFSGEFRVSEKIEKGRMLVGFRPRTKDGKNILAWHVNYISSKIGTLAAPVAKGDKLVKIQGVSSWNIKQPHYMLAMNAKEDMSDLPNFDLSPMLVKASGKAAGDDVRVFELQKPFAKDYPAGTAVRLHTADEIHIFVGVATNPYRPGTEWQTFTGKISGQKARNVRNWYPGTAQAAAVMFPTAGLNKVQVRNVKITME